MVFKRNSEEYAKILDDIISDIDTTLDYLKKVNFEQI